MTSRYSYKFLREGIYFWPRARSEAISHFEVLNGSRSYLVQKLWIYFFLFPSWKFLVFSLELQKFLSITKGLSIYDGLLMMSGLRRLRCFFVPPIFEFWVWFIATKYLRPSVQKESIKLFFKCYFNNHCIITNELSNSWIKST